MVMKQEPALRGVGRVGVAVAGEVGDGAAGQVLQYGGLSGALSGGSVTGGSGFGKRRGMGQATPEQAVGPVSSGTAGSGRELLTGIAAAQLAGEDFLTGLDRRRADAAGQQITPVPGLASTTAAGLARRLTPGQWRAVESGLAVVTSRMLSLLPAERMTALAAGRSRSTWTPPTWRSTAARNAAWRTTTRASGPGGRTWRPGPRPRPCCRRPGQRHR